MRADDSAAGKNGKCKDCGNVVRVPATQQVHATQIIPVAVPAQQHVAQKQEVQLYHRHPSMFRNRPILFCICVLLCLVVVGLVILLIWWIIDLGTTLTVTDRRSTLRHGIFSKRITEIWHKDVRNVVVHQTFMQRIFGVGSIGVSSAGGPGLEIQVHGMAMPYDVKKIIDAGR